MSKQVGNNNSKHLCSLVTNIFAEALLRPPSPQVLPLPPVNYATAENYHRKRLPCSYRAAGWGSRQLIKVNNLTLVSVRC